jgi:hypothetical protein
MATFTRHPFLRFAAIVWLLIAMAILAVALQRSGTGPHERTALSTLVPLYFLSFPSGHMGVRAVSRLKVKLYHHSNYVPEVAAEAVALWTSLTVLGYLQWFVLVPWVARGLRWLAGFLCGRLRAG